MKSKEEELKECRAALDLLRIAAQELLDASTANDHDDEETYEAEERLEKALGKVGTV
jgi:hypothetical protein